MKWVKHGLCHLLAHRTLELCPDYQNMEDFMYSIPERFAAGEGTVVYKGRNELRKMTYGGLDLVVKSFHRPNLINRFVYGVFPALKSQTFLRSCEDVSRNRGRDPRSGRLS